MLSFYFYKHTYIFHRNKYIYIKTGMTTFINIIELERKNEVQVIRWSDNIDKYRLAANITEYHIISKLILQRIIITNFCAPVSHLR